MALEQVTLKYRVRTGEVTGTFALRCTVCGAMFPYKDGQLGLPKTCPLQDLVARVPTADSWHAALHVAAVSSPGEYMLGFGITPHEFMRKQHFRCMTHGEPSPACVGGHCRFVREEVP